MNKLYMLILFFAVAAALASCAKDQANPGSNPNFCLTHPQADNCR